MRPFGVVVWLLLALPAPAQQGPTFKISDSVINAGGQAGGFAALGSSRFRITLDGIGEAFAGPRLAGTSYSMRGSFSECYPPPGEVHGLFFSDRDTIVWSPERSVGRYNLYRAPIGELGGSDYGSCEQPNLPQEWANDTAEPPPGDGFFYLVTAKNRLDEEGTRGTDSAGTERAGPSVCP